MTTEEPAQKPNLLQKVGITPYQLIIILILLFNLILALTNHQALDTSVLKLDQVSAQTCPPAPRSQTAFAKPAA